MNYSDIKLEIDERKIAWLTLNREDKHNAIGTQMMIELRDACDWLNKNHEVRAIVITGAGNKSFSAGADLSWMKENFRKNREERIRESSGLANTLEAINTLNKITIARINGKAYAGAVGIISVCDVAISVNTARFSMTETRLGLTPANISPYVIQRIGVSKSRRILLNAHFFDADEAVELGLIHTSVKPDQLDEAVESEIKNCLSCAPGAIAMTKELIRNVSMMSPEESKIYTAQKLADAWETDEARAGIGRFFEKKLPPWAE